MVTVNHILPVSLLRDFTRLGNKCITPKAYVDREILKDQPWLMIANETLIYESLNTIKKATLFQ